MDNPDEGTREKCLTPQLDAIHGQLSHEFVSQ